jgi:hypothetical protein
MRRSLATCILVFAISGCTNDDGSGQTNSASNNAPTNNASNNSSSSNATTSNNTTNTVPNNTIAPRREPYVTQFRYVQPGALGQLEFELTYADGTIGTGTVGMGNIQRISDEHRESIDALLGDDTIGKMRNGWGCREPGSGDMGVDAGVPGVYRFEARIKEGEVTEEVQDISGCVADQDPAVVEIIDAIELLELLYL